MFFFKYFQLFIEILCVLLPNKISYFIEIKYFSIFQQISIFCIADDVHLTISTKHVMDMCFMIF